jgi:tetratricopeptide (TPR) repeat protein
MIGMSIRRLVPNSGVLDVGLPTGRGSRLVPKAIGYANDNAAAVTLAQESYRSLAKTNPEVYLPYVAITLNNLGVLSRAENRNAEARKQYEEAQEIRRDLAKTNPEVYLPNVATTLNNLGNLSHAENRNAEARKQYEEALEVFRQFAQREPNAYESRVRRVENNLRSLSQ